MKNRSNDRKGAFISGLALILLLASCGGGKEEALYTCPMHPEIVQKGPGSCPLCHMDLVKKETDRIAVSALETLSPVQRDLSAIFRAQGIVEPDVQTLRKVTARAAGRIERLYVRSPNKRVRKGDLLYSLYSPDLSALQRQWLEVLTGDAPSLAAALRQRLLFLGMSPEQLEKVKSTRQPVDTVHMTSPTDGIVVALGEKTSPPPAGAPSEMAMGGQPAAPATPDKAPLREGDYLREGTVLFTLADPFLRWAMLTILPGDAFRIRQGQRITVQPLSDTSAHFTGRVDLIEPFVRDGALGPLAHAHLEKAENLPFNTLVEAVVEAGKTQGLFIPAAAVVDLGRRKIAWVNNEGSFTAREIITGNSAEGWVEVLSGLTLNDHIAPNAQYLSDSEAFIKTEPGP